MVRVFQVDEDGMHARLIREMIADRSPCSVCGYAEGGKETLARIRKSRPAVVVINMGFMIGGSLRLVDEVSRTTKTRMLGYGLPLQDDDLVHRLFRIGMTGCVSKKDQPDAMIEGIIAVAQKRKYLGPALRQALSQARTDTLILKGRPATTERLSDRELEVFYYSGASMLLKEIADQMGISPKTVETYRIRIRTKLGIATPRAFMQVAQRLAQRRWEDSSNL